MKGSAIFLPVFVSFTNGMKGIMQQMRNQQREDYEAEVNRRENGNDWSFYTKTGFGLPIERTSTGLLRWNPHPSRVQEGLVNTDFPHHYPRATKTPGEPSTSERAENASTGESQEDQETTPNLLEILEKSTVSPSGNFVLTKANADNIVTLYRKEEKASVKKLEGKFKHLLRKGGELITLEKKQPFNGTTLEYSVPYVKNTGKPGKALVVEWKCVFGGWKFVLSYYDDEKDKRIPIAHAEAELDLFEGVTDKQFQCAMKKMNPAERMFVAIHLQPQDWKFHSFIFPGKRGRFNTESRRRLAQRMAVASNYF